MKFSTANECFLKDNKPFFLVSGEIHYFRLAPELWEKHLKLLKQSGANTTSTYIPWDWHEYEEGKFDFAGETDPARNLIRYITLCKKNDLNLIVKPGPYILAEYENQGLPEWLIKKTSKAAQALDENGNIISPDLMSYLSDEFLNYSFLWYDNVIPLLVKYQYQNGGPIIMLQVCNEVGVFQWLSGSIDYNPSVLKLYKQFLSEKYKTIDKLNKVYGSDHPSFNNICPPVGKIENRKDYCAYYDFHLFYRKYFAVYLDVLSKRIKSYGFEAQLTHNIPGWIYGNAAELPMLISTYDEVLKTNKNIVFGLDHIPEFISFRNAHSDLACNKILKALQQQAPVWVAEFQAGTREHHVKCYAKDMETFYIASLAHGIKGFNYYMFSQGCNPKGKGFYGKTFYYQTPLLVDAKKTELYNSIKKVNSFINDASEDLLLSNNNSDVCIGFYKPYFSTELTTSQMLKDKRLSVEKLGLQYDPRFIREELLFNGLLRILQTLNINYDFKDLEDLSLDIFLKYKQLWIVATEFMDARTQQLLAAYVKKGGELILYPVIPEYDLYLNPCTKLKDELKIKFIKSASPKKIQAFGIKDIFTFFRDKLIFNEKNAAVVALTNLGEVCGIRKKVGKGLITVFGFAFGYTSDEHLHLVEKILSQSGIKSRIKLSDATIQCVLRKGKKHSYLFLINYHNQEKKFKADSNVVTLKPFSYKIIRTELRKTK